MARKGAGPDPMLKQWSGAGRNRSCEMLNYATKAADASFRNDIKEAIFDRVIGDLIMGLETAAYHIPRNDLGSTNEAIAAISAAVDFLDELRRR